MTEQSGKLTKEQFARVGVDEAGIRESGAPQSFPTGRMHSED